MSSIADIERGMNKIAGINGLDRQTWRLVLLGDRFLASLAILFHLRLEFFNTHQMIDARVVIIRLVLRLDLIKRARDDPQPRRLATAGLSDNRGPRRQRF